MATRTKSFPFPFPVADTEAGPVLNWDSQTLSLNFTDYQNIARTVRFVEVSHFELLVEDELDCTIYHYDGAVEVLDSPLIAKLVEIGEINQGDSVSFKHLVIGFNEVGAFLVVVCRSLETG
ncbi:hypothetical protein ACFQY0_20750 [Haloferula chungangensis]|uniref:Halobacterial output domain-containing protein n=1 Tax=Haloferula chungangensis TaxID=1048331 RepID=A0ABW2LAY9_9BACT